MSKFELRRLCKAVNATALVRLGAPTPEEMGFADEVAVLEVSSKLVTVFRQSDEDSAVATIVLRGSTMSLLDDMERAIDDAVHTAKVRGASCSPHPPPQPPHLFPAPPPQVLCKDGRLVPGAGAVEMELAHRIAALGAASPGLEQYAMNKFAEALGTTPRPRFCRPPSHTRTF